MINKETSKLLLKTFDGTLRKLELKPKYMDSTVSFDIKYYDYDGSGEAVNATILFREVVAIDIEINLFASWIGSDLCGFYEILHEEKKKEMIEKIFQTRLDGFLYHGDYNYDASDPNDMLNDRESIETLYKELEKYHLYQQQTDAGIYYILASSYIITEDMHNTI